MMRRLTAALCMAILTAGSFPSESKAQPEQSVHDIVVYGDSSGAVVAAIAAKREGRSVIWVNPSGFPGRKRTAAYGLAKDEFTDNGGWPWMIYIREARRMVGDYVMTQQDCEGQRAAPDPVALGSFGMDSHVVQRFVTESGHVNSDGVIWRVPPKPYDISYRSILPRQGECQNVLSPVCVSASHVAHGSIRMEPVFMVLGQSAATAAGMAIDENVSVQDVAYPALRKKLEAAQQILRPEADKQPSSPRKVLSPKHP